MNVGIDAVEFDRMARALTDGFVTGTFHESERGGSVAQLSGHFAAKEAILKAVDVPLALAPLAAITVDRGRAQFHSQHMRDLVARRGIRVVHVSVTVGRSSATAVALAEHHKEDP